MSRLVFLSIALELRLIKPLLKDRARVHPLAGNSNSWREADLTQYSNASPAISNHVQ